MCVILTANDTTSEDPTLIDKEAILCSLNIKTMEFSNLAELWKSSTTNKRLLALQIKAAQRESVNRHLSHSFVLVAPAASLCRRHVLTCGVTVCFSGSQSRTRRGVEPAQLDSHRRLGAHAHRTRCVPAQRDVTCWRVCV